MHSAKSKDNFPCAPSRRIRNTLYGGRNTGRVAFVAFWRIGEAFNKTKSKKILEDGAVDGDSIFPSERVVRPDVKVVITYHLF